jgi:hypothetical protein
MFRSLLTAPRWLLSIIYGVFFWAWMVVFGLVWDGFRVGALLSSVLGGLIFGVWTGRQAYEWNQHAREVAGPLTDQEFREVARTQRRGPVPSRPQLREAAARLLRFRLAEHDKQRRPMLFCFAGLTVSFAVAAALGTRWWAAFAVMGAVALIAQLLLPARLDRRLRVLETAPAASERDNQDDGRSDPAETSV